MHLYFYLFKIQITHYITTLLRYENLTGQEVLFWIEVKYKLFPYNAYVNIIKKLDLKKVYTTDKY